MADELTVVFWLPNIPSTHGELMAAFGSAGRVGDEFYELVSFSPQYPNGLSGPLVRIEVVFERVSYSPYQNSFDNLFRGAFSPWPFGR
jgi:hypothetical protein